MEFSDSFVMTMSGVDATRAWTDIARMLIIDAACEACCIDVMATSQVIEAVQHACIDAFIWRRGEANVKILSKMQKRF